MLYQLSYTHRKARRIYFTQKSAQAPEHLLHVSRASAALLLVVMACSRSSLTLSPLTASEPSADRQTYDAATAALQQQYLDRGTVARLAVDHAPQSQTRGDLLLTVAPVSAEDQAWNAWPDGTTRLFNDAIGYLWRVSIRSEHTVRWSPAHTQLAVNDSEQTFLAVAEPDALLEHLMLGARFETRVGAPPNLSLRMRGADDFRRAYLGTDARAGDRDGVLLFPAPARNLQAVAMELTIGLWREEDGVQTYRFLFE